MPYILCCILILVMHLITFIYILLYQRNKYLSKILDIQNEASDYADKCLYYLKENTELQKTLQKYQEEKLSNLEFLEIYGERIKYNPIYKGKRALVGDYMATSYNITKTVLQSLGFSVDVVNTYEDVVKKIKYGEHYDIIFSNNIYRHGTGADCLTELRNLPNFSTPVVILTVTADKRDYFVNKIGFDDYVVKPISQEKIIPILNNLLKN